MKAINLRLAIMLHDLAMVAVAWCAAYLLRYNFAIHNIPWNPLLQSLPLVLIAQGVVLHFSNLYRGLWRFASVPDLWNIGKAAGWGTLAFALTLFVFNRFEGVPRTSLLLYPVFLAFALGLPRLVYRVWKDRGYAALRNGGPRERVLLLGAGRAGEMLAREMSRDGSYTPVGFLDDKKHLKGAKVHGVPVIGPIRDLPQTVKRLAVDVVVIAMPSASNTEMRRVVELCEQSGTPFRTLPRLQDMMCGRSPLGSLRQVSVEDFLGRAPVKLDWRSIGNEVAGKTVLITGAGGSIGAELSRQIARLGPAKLVLFEQSEFSVYTVELDLRREFPNLLMSCALGTVSDRVAVEHVFSIHSPEVVFHAAAYKHVPILQSQPREAVKNNILGTKVVAEAADKFGCQTFVLISTDKAVKPANYMGATKRVAEIYCQTLNARSATRFMTVRFGNVLGSAGSVVPLFQRQIESGGPVTVTHPEITRYFMTIPEACQLILQASVMGRGGEIFVLDMGEPVKISYLAEQMIRLAGKVPGEDVELIYTGLRPGEKLYEELFYDQENLVNTTHDKILLAHPSATDWEKLNQGLDRLSAACERYDEEQIIAGLHDLVPELATDDWVAEDNVIQLKRVSA